MKKIKKQHVIKGGAVIALFLAGVFLLNQQQAVKKVKADTLPTTGSVTLDGDDATNKYVVPADATGRGGLDLPDDEDWFQNAGNIPSLSKNIINTYTSNIDDSAQYAGTLSDGTVLFQVDSRSEKLSAFPSAFLFRKVMLKTEADGEKLSEVYLATGTSSYSMNANNSGKVLESSRDGGLPTISNNNQVSGVYHGTKPNGSTTETKYAYTFDGATMAGFSWKQVTTPFTKPNSYALNRIDAIPGQNDGKQYVIEGGRVLDVTEGNDREGLEVLEYDAALGEIRETGHTMMIDSVADATGHAVSRSTSNYFSDLRRYGDCYILLVFHGTYVDSVPSVSHIYKLDATDWSKIDSLQVSDLGTDIVRANAVEGLNIADTTHYYYMDYSNDKSRLMKLKPDTFTTELVKEFPKGTIVQDITKYTNSDGDDEYSVYMTLDSEAVNDAMFSSYLSDPGIVLGTLDENLAIKNLRGLAATGTLTMNSFSPIPNTTDLYAIAGAASVDSDFITGPYNKRPGATQAAFYGTLSLLDDYSPGIKFTKNNLIVDINSSKATLETALLDGIEVTDTYDFSDKNISGKKDMEWLRARINRNPNRINYLLPENQRYPEIDWETLGFDKTSSGPQKVKYFVSDGSLQSSAISRWINKTTTETKIDEDKEYALDAHNFHLPLEGIASSVSTDEKFKELAKTVAWSLINHESSDGDHGEGLDEDSLSGKFSDSKVKVDQAQLEALQKATTAKPYPVDIVYTPETGVEITNRVWVFVTGKNTLPNSETNPAVTPKDSNGLVYYADDYSLPFRLRGTQDKDQILTDGNVKVYDYYDSTHEDVDELPALADANTVPDKLTGNFQVVQNATAPGVLNLSINYKWEGATDAYHTTGETITGNLDVTLTGHALWHVRQVILDASDEIVVPSESYLTIENVLTNGGTSIIDANYQANLTAKSDKLSASPAFTEVSIPTDHLPNAADQVQLSLVVPEFYQYLGYYCTTEQADSQGSSHIGHTTYTNGLLQLDKTTLNDPGEFWITLYLKPNQTGQGTNKTPQPYSWDYEQNDLGKIKTK